MIGILFVLGLVFGFLALFWAVYKSQPTKKEIRE